jgi:ATP-dependent protease HslVU (ClpYQ) peptidase subunit
MSCIVGLVDKKKVYLGSDGIASTEDGDMHPIYAIKMFKRGSYILGFAGSIRTGQIIQRGSYKLPKNIWGWPDIIREQITEKGAIVTAEGQVQIQMSNFIIGHKGKLYELLSDFQINEVNEEGYTAIGAGTTVALGSLFTSKGLDFTPEQRIYLALNAAAEFVASCGPPYTIKVLE